MYKFLIIDDEPVVREGIAGNIDWEAHGFRLVGTCRDGREGLQAVEELRPDVVLTDICMPFVDGLELAASIAEQYPATKTILLTGHDEFEGSLPPGTAVADEDRHVITVRLTKLLMEQNLHLSLFTFYSPSDQDMYLRPKAHYKISDSWAVEGGGNIFVGDEDHTFFGQFEDNTNMYAAMRYSF